MCPSMCAVLYDKKHTAWDGTEHAASADRDVDAKIHSHTIPSRSRCGAQAYPYATQHREPALTNER